MVIDLARVGQATVNRAPYPYFVSTDVLQLGEASAVASSFPAIDRPGAIAVDDTAYGAAFQRLLDELRSDAFRKIIADKLGVDLDGKEIVINVRGQSRWTDGNIHTDSPSKLVTVLLYFNEPGEATKATALRILKNGRNIDDFVEEVPPLLGSMLAFKVTPDCWHGFKPYSGPRHSLQLNYLSGIKTRHKHEGCPAVRTSFAAPGRRGCPDRRTRCGRVMAGDVGEAHPLVCKADCRDHVPARPFTPRSHAGRHPRRRLS